MRWQHAARQWHGLQRSAFLKNQEHVPAGNVQRAETFIAFEPLESENPSVEFGGARHIVDVDGGFQYPGDGHILFRCRSASSSLAGNLAASSRLCVTTTSMVRWLRCRSSNICATVSADA